MKRLRLIVRGIVQGVGFRPFVYKVASSLGLTGWVLNDEEGVKMEIEGDEEKLEGFLRELLSNPPPRAEIEEVEKEELEPIGYSSFEIRESEKSFERSVLISPDIATCEDCLRELFDPQDRRYRYPFINCTNCGPRFTIIKDVPYDRDKTTMASFKMCPDCFSEYHDPWNRRFHAQPNACPLCGPKVFLLDREGREIQTEDPIREAIRLLQQGKILAVKGLGGFHLACDPFREEVVWELRRRKWREDKPFALMCKNLEVVKELCFLEDGAERLLLSKERPIVILKRRPFCGIAPSVAPRQNTLGVMLPYTPLHHLLFQDGIRCLVMTSGNISDEPIAYKDQEALERLSKIADFFLTHNRPIWMRCDDSVLKVFRDKPLFFRRSRGYVPKPIFLKGAKRKVLALGAELKNTFCITRGPYAFLSHHIGDLENYETFRSFEEAIEHFKKLLRVEPELLVHDLHPDYLSTRYALEKDMPRLAIQHHFAHALSCMAEYGLEGPVLGIIMDGTGFGEDATVWGCEFLEVRVDGFFRLGHLRYIEMPGGEKAIREPWRMGAIYLERAFEGNLMMERYKELGWDLLKEGVKKGLNAPLCSSMGRLFDAVSSLLGLRDMVNYEGQAAIELEAIADPKAQGDYPFEMREYVVDPLPMIRAIVRDLEAGVNKGQIAMRFHRTVSKMILKVAQRAREERGLQEVVLSGGCFQNLLLLELTTSLLEGDSFKVYTHHKVPPNDGGLSLGQAYYGSRWEA